jgi:hypothetical protein
MTNIDRAFKFEPYPDFMSDCHRLNLGKDVISRLAIYLNSVKGGSDRILISPTFEGVDLNRLKSEMNGILENNLNLINKTLYEMELSQREKFGPRSIAKPFKDRIPSINDHFKSFTSVGRPRPLSANYGIRPIGESSAIKLLKNDTNSGLPYFVRKSKVKSFVLSDLRNSEREYPCVLFTRTQELGKTRDVWGYPIFDTIKEMRYYSPLLKVQKRQPYRKALIDADAVDVSITGLINKAKRYNYTIVSIDFSGYDATVKSELQSASFDYIKSCFRAECSSEISSIQDRFNTIPLLTPSGIWRGSHGVPSGSTFTNEVDSIAQATIANELDFIDLNDCQIQGDDGVYILPKDSVPLLFDQFEKYGLKVNRDKTVVSDDYSTFLQCLYHPEFSNTTGIIGGIYPIYRALNRIVYLERFVGLKEQNILGKDYFSIRTISILENCKNHPLFEEFVKLILRYDKYSLNFDDSGLAKYVSNTSKASGRDVFINHRRGLDVSGIKNFETFKLIQRLMSRA